MRALQLVKHRLSIRAHTIVHLYHTCRFKLILTNTKYSYKRNIEVTCSDSPFVLIMAAPSEILRKASPKSRAPQTNGTLKSCLLMWFSSSAGVNTIEKNRR